MVKQYSTPLPMANGCGHTVQTPSKQDRQTDRQKQSDRDSQTDRWMDYSISLCPLQQGRGHNET